MLQLHVLLASFLGAKGKWINQLRWVFYLFMGKDLQELVLNQ